ncbi:hypothetical protein BV898_01368 [Hypsibius exemplaris]|uniref:Uncharacterized protein n=1 Tax=Hypsibius exemplaris TaxID=2072580 RepID=A0A1W0XB95_HYPEX|nr:hypothetical protein BV898_01368 [Hypsibius exemplaris]
MRAESTSIADEVDLPSYQHVVPKRLSPLVVMAVDPADPGMLIAGKAFNVSCRVYNVLTTTLLSWKFLSSQTLTRSSEGVVYRPSQGDPVAVRVGMWQLYDAHNTLTVHSYYPA